MEKNQKILKVLEKDQLNFFNEIIKTGTLSYLNNNIISELKKSNQYRYFYCKSINSKKNAAAISARGIDAQGIYPANYPRNNRTNKQIKI